MGTKNTNPNESSAKEKEPKGMAHGIFKLDGPGLTAGKKAIKPSAQAAIAPRVPIPLAALNDRLKHTENKPLIPNISKV